MISSSTQTLQLYAGCTGQEDNIGDVVLRRRFLHAIRPFGRLHVYVGDASPSFVEGLELSPSDKVYTDRAAWLGACGKGDSSYFKNPGEIGVGLREEVAHLIASLRLKFHGGKFFILGPGLRGPISWMRKLALRPALACSSLCYWRDSFSPAHLKVGKVMPDWAFADFGPEKQPPNSSPVPSALRGKMAVSLRYDREYPSGEWLKGVREFARRAGLEIIVVTQVRRDGVRSKALARDLDAGLMDWGDESHLEQESRLRFLYRECRLIISDRLHVLIIGLTEGAVPLCCIPYDEVKVGRHFEAIELEGVSLCCRNMPAMELASLIEASYARLEANAPDRLKKAGESIQAVEKNVATCLGFWPPRSVP